MKNRVHIEVELGGYSSSLDVEDQRDISRVLWGSTKVELYPGSLNPLASFRSLASLYLIIGHLHWAPEVVPVLGIFLYVRL